MNQFLTKDAIRQHVLNMPNETDARILMADIHARNVAAGWWTDLDTKLRKARNVGELLALMHSEISEAYDSYVEHDYEQPDSHLPHLSNVVVEIGDFCIRLFDTAAAYACSMPVVFYFNSRVIEEDRRWVEEHDPYGFSAVANRLHSFTSQALEAHRKGGEIDLPLARALNTAVWFCRCASLPLADAIADKIEYNGIRQDHKVENRLAQGGKKI